MRPPRREEILTLIASPCLLRSDRAGRALFISDFEARAPGGGAAGRLRAAGYALRREDALTLIDWPDEAYAAYYEGLPPAALPPLSGENAALWGLCSILMRHEAPLSRQDMGTLALALRLARLNDTGKLLRLLRGALAEALREGKAPPAHAARLLSAMLNDQTEYYMGR